MKPLIPRYWDVITEDLTAANTDVLLKDFDTEKVFGQFTILKCTGDVTLRLANALVGNRDLVITALTWPAMIVIEGLPVRQLHITSAAQAGKELVIVWWGLSQE